MTYSISTREKVMSILAYFGILLVVPLVCEQESGFVRYHTNQGLLLFLACLVNSALTYVPIIKFLSYFIGIILFVFFVIGIINVLKGEMKELPIIGKYSILK